MVVQALDSVATGSQVTPPTFDMTKYLYVSKQVSKLFPTLPESRIIEEYHSIMPGRVLTGPWRDNLDIVYGRDGMWKTWKNDAHRYFREGGIMKSVRDVILWIASLPVIIQRLLVSGWVIASMFALWYFVRNWIEWSGIWWFAVSVIGLVILIASFATYLCRRKRVSLLSGGIGSRSVSPHRPPALMRSNGMRGVGLMNDVNGYYSSSSQFPPMGWSPYSVGDRMFVDNGSLDELSDDDGGNLRGLDFEFADIYRVGEYGGTPIRGGR